MDEFNLLKWLKEFGVIILPGIVGLVILLYGLWQTVKPQAPKVEIIKNAEIDNNTQLGTTMVDVEGEVQKPGVYKLPSGARIGDGLVAAGGLSVKADREWVSKNLNLAEEVKDGRKIYIPEKSENSDNQKTLPAQAGQNVRESDKPENQKGGKVNINTASQDELETLWGIGEARAQTIIGSRPYGASEELVSKAKIPQSVYEKISSQISVY